MWYSRCKGSHACTKEHAETAFQCVYYVQIYVHRHPFASNLLNFVQSSWTQTVILTYDRANVLT